MSVYGEIADVEYQGVGYKNFNAKAYLDEPSWITFERRFGRSVNLMMTEVRKGCRPMTRYITPLVTAWC